MFKRVTVLLALLLVALACVRPAGIFATRAARASAYAPPANITFIDAYEVAERAQPLYPLFITNPYIESFEGEPPRALAQYALQAYINALTDPSTQPTSQVTPAAPGDPTPSGDQPTPDGAPAAPNGALTLDEAYSHIFAHGAFATLAPYDNAAYAPPRAPDDGAPPARAIIESAINSGAGEVIVSIKAEYNYGEGWEFGFLLDINLLPAPEAPFGARVTKVFIPE